MTDLTMRCKNIYLNNFIGVFYLEKLRSPEPTLKMPEIVKGI